MIVDMLIVDMESKKRGVVDIVSCPNKNTDGSSCVAKPDIQHFIARLAQHMILFCLLRAPDLGYDEE